jgi:hypothetical protein
VSAHSAGAYTATLLVMVKVMKGGGRAPPPSPAWANFTLMMECTPESSRCYSVYPVCNTICVQASSVVPRAASRGPRLNALEEADEEEEEEDGEEGELRGEDGGRTEDRRTDDIQPVEEVRPNEHFKYHDLALCMYQQRKRGDCMAGEVEVRVA